MIGPSRIEPDGHTPRYYLRRRGFAMSHARSQAYVRDRLTLPHQQPMRVACAEQVAIRVRQARRLNWQAIRARRPLVVEDH